MPLDAIPSSPPSGPVLRGACSMCPVGGRCLTSDLPADEAHCWAGALIPHLPLAQPGKALYTAGAPADCVYVVRAGCIKTFTVDESGQERVRGFFLPGDVVGLGSIGIGSYPDNAVAVVASQVCRVAKGQLQGLLAKAPALNQRLLERLTAELRLALALSGDFTADQRVAAFLLHLQERLDRPGDELRLPMGRRDVANYLRLATETVCRVLARFESRNWLHSDDKRLTLLDPLALSEIAAPVGICRPRLRLAA